MIRVMKKKESENRGRKGVMEAVMKKKWRGESGEWEKACDGDLLIVI